MDEESRGRTVTNMIRTLSPKIGVKIYQQTGLTEADMWLRLAEGLLPAYDQPQLSEAATDQPAATPSYVMALAGLRAWAEYEADTDGDDAVICPPTRTLLALMEVRESQGRAVIQVTVEQSEDREDQPTTPLPRVLPPALSKHVFRCALTAKAICTGPLLANLELPTVEQLAEAIAATISQRINTPPKLQHAQWLTDTMTAAGVERHHRHTAPTLLRVGDDNLYVISLGNEDEEFADTLRLAADDEEELELNYEENDSATEVDTAKPESHQLRNPQRLSILLKRHPSQPTPAGKGKAATTAKHKKKQPRGRSRSDGGTRNRSMSKPRLSGTRGSDIEWETDDDAAHPSSISHQ
eukprot:jgi/Tetstr1/424879/TSEL_015374.t1